MAVHSSTLDPPPTGDERVCIHCGKRVSPDRKRLCNHCGLPFREDSAAEAPIEEPLLNGPQLLKIAAVLAFVLPPLGPLGSLFSQWGGAEQVAVLALIAGMAALLWFAWRRPLPGGILVTLSGIVPFMVGAFTGATGSAAGHVWLYWFLPGGVIGGGLFVAAAFRQAPGAPEAGPAAAGEGPVTVGLVERVKREGLGLAGLVVVGLVFLAVAGSYTGGAAGPAYIVAINFLGWPLLFVAAGVLGYRLGHARGSFITGLVAAAAAMVGMVIAQVIAGTYEGIRAAPGEGIGEAWLILGFMFVAGGFFGLLGGGVAALTRAH